MGRNLTSLPISASFQYLLQISGSENDLNDGLGNDVDLLNVTASYATQALTASFAENAGASTLQEVLDNSNTATQDIVLTGEYQRISGSFSGSAIDNITDTFTSGEKVQHVVTLTQAEYNALTPDVNTFYVIVDANAAMITASVSDATITFTKDDATTFDIEVTNVSSSISASHAAQADSALAADTSTSASHALIADDLVSTANININSITASNASFTSASIGFLESITGSAKIIGDAYIILNNNTPTERYAGIVVQDSGSTNNTASLEFDGQTNDWFYEYTDDGGATTEHGVVMFGPEYSTKGTHVYPTANTLVKGNGGHHLEDSSISDDGTLVTVDANISASGYISASEFIGDGSGLTNLPAANAFPFTGSADITGSLDLVGPLTSGDGTNTVGTNGNEVAIGGYQNSATGNTSAVVGGEYSTASGFRAAVFGGEAGTSTGTNSTVVGGYNNTAGGSYTGISHGSGNNVGGNSVAILGGQSNTINNAGRAVILGGEGHYIGGGNDQGYIIGGGEDNVINANGGDGIFVIGGKENDVRNFHGTSNSNEGWREVYGGIVGGYQNVIGQSGNTGANGFPIIIGGKSNKIGPTTSYLGPFTDNNVIIGNSGSTTDSGSFQQMYGGVNNYISGSDNAYIYGAQNTTITGRNNVVVIGGNGVEATKDDTVFVPNITVSGSAVGEVNSLTITSNTASMDCSLGNMFTLTINQQSDVHLDATNIQAGQTINLEVLHDATNSGSLSFAPSEFLFSGGTAPTITAAASSKDILTFVSFENTALYGTSLLNFS